MILRTATEAEKRQRDDVSYEAWGPPLSRPAWFAREERLRAHRWSQAAMTTWLWCEGAQILSSCETFRMASRAAGTPGHAYGIASVFTEPLLRGRGHAVSMLRALHARLAAEDARAQAAILFSDVGAPIYRRAGYLEQTAFDLELRPSSERPDVEWISERDLPQALRAMTPPSDPFVVWPSAEQLDWHLERERIYADALSRPRPPYLGASDGAASALWAGVLRSDTLAILLLQAGAAQETENVLRAAAFAAHRAGLKKVTLWETPGLPVRVSRVPRDGSLPMIAPLHASVSAEGWRTIPRALWI